MNARDWCYFCKKDLGSSYTYHWGNKAHIKCEAANELPSLKRRVEAAGFTIMSKEDVDAVRDKALDRASEAALAILINDTDSNPRMATKVENAIRSLKSGGRNGKEARE